MLLPISPASSSIFAVMSRKRHYSELRKTAGECAVCQRAPLRDSGELMLIFHLLDRDLTGRYLSHMSIKDQEKHKSQGVWLCLFCQKRENVFQRQVNALFGTEEELLAWEKSEERWKWIHLWMLEQKKCGICDLQITEDNVICFEMDHIDTKYQAICAMVGKGEEDDLIRAELKRCRVLCVECHAKVSAQQASTKSFPQRVDVNGLPIIPMKKEKVRKRKETKKIKKRKRCKTSINSPIELVLKPEFLQELRASATNH